MVMSVRYVHALVQFLSARNVLMRVAPPGLDQVIPMMCGTCSNENAMKLMFMKYMERERGGRIDFNEVIKFSFFI